VTPPAAPVTAAAPATASGAPDVEIQLRAAHADQKQAAAERKPRRKRSLLRTAALLIGLIAVGGGAAIAARAVAWAPAAPVKTGSVSIQSSPPGVEIVVDGLTRGQTPANLTLDAGPHILELRGRGVPRVIPITIEPGASISQYIELAEAPLSGQLQVTSEIAGLAVSVDGKPGGVTPVTLTDLAPGPHAVVVETPGGGAFRQAVDVQAGVTASVFVPASPTPTGPVSGWVTVSIPVAMDIYENGRLLGTTETERLMMASGRHELELVNETLGFRTSRVVQVVAGKVTTVAVELPRGTVSINALPWAEVWIDGQRVGETPLGNLQVPIGPHEVVFRHPEFGEQRHAISVRLSGTARLSVDLRQRH
jgi:hypothetical protein